MQLNNEKKDFYFEDFIVGQVFRSPSFEMTPEVIIDFAKVYDPQYYHLDAERARNSIFGGLVCGGFQTASLSWGLALRTGLFDKCGVAGIGIDELRWLLPVREGDFVHAEFWLSEGRPSKTRPGIATATFTYRVCNQKNETVLTLRLIQLLKCRPSVEAGF
jgi:acyl dehydratase